MSQAWWKSTGWLSMVMLLLWACTPQAPDSRALEQARRALAAQQPEAAIAILAPFPNKTAAAYELLAKAYRRLPERGGEVEAVFGPAVRGGKAGLILLAARTAAATDQLGTALDWLEEGAEQHPRELEFTIEKAKILGRLGRFDQAVAALEPHVSGNPRVLNLIGYSELLAGNDEKGRAYLERAIAEAEHLGRPYAVAHYHLGRYFLGQDALEQAAREFREAVRINPQHMEAQYLLMGVEERLGVDASAARKAFAALYEKKLRAEGALDEEEPSAPAEVERSDRIVWRPEVSSPQFRRIFPAGATIEVACHVPRGERALFSVRISGGTGKGEVLLKMIHEGEGASGEWIPHLLTLPSGSGESIVEFAAYDAGLLGRLFGAAPPSGATFSVPETLPGATGRSLDARPNILLISLDTLRADHLSSYGALRETSPVIDALAARGIRFTSAEAANNWTLPSHMSIFSGLTPAAHGVLPDMGQVRGYLHPDRKLPLSAAPGLRLFPQALADAGYRNAAVTENGWVSGRFGFNRGFRVFRSDLRGSLDRTAAAALEQLELSGERGPWFLFVHTYTAHQPYHAPEEYRLRWARPGHVGFAWPRARVPISDYYRFRAPVFPPAPSDIGAFRDLYDGQVAWADSLVGTLVDWLEERGLLEQTIIAVTSDHGEEIFERGQFDHGDTLHEEVTHVPLVLAGGGLPQGKVVGTRVSLVDLSATLLDLAGLGREFGLGRSLRGAWEGSAPFSRGELAFAEAIDFQGRELSAVWRGDLKYLRRGQGEGAEEELYDLRRDPEEHRNLVDRRPKVASRLRALLDAHRANAAEIQSVLGNADEELDEELIRRLTSLGYGDPGGR